MSMKRVSTSFLAILIVALLLCPLVASAEDDIWAGTEGRVPRNELEVLGIGGYSPDQTTGTYTFKGLVGLGVTSDIRYNKVPLEGVSIKVYDDLGVGWNAAFYEDKVPIAETVSGEIFFNNEAEERPYQKYRNFSIEIPGFVGKDRDLIFVYKLDGYEPFAADGYLRPVKVYSVTFDANGGSPVNPITGLLLNSTVTEPSAPVKDGYNFNGWFKEPDFINEWNFNTDTISQNRTLYAKWSEIPVPVFYTVTYTDGVDDEVIFEDETYQVEEKSGTPRYAGSLAREGYTFKGGSLQ